MKSQYYTNAKKLRGNHPIACSGKPKLSTWHCICKTMNHFPREKGILELWATLKGINSIQAPRVLPTLVGSGRPQPLLRLVLPPLTDSKKCWNAIFNAISLKCNHHSGYPGQNLGHAEHEHTIVKKKKHTCRVYLNTVGDVELLGDSFHLMCAAREIHLVSWYMVP